MTERTVNGQMIVLARQYRSLSAKALAEQIGVSASHLSMMESSTRAVREERVLALSSALRVRPSFFSRPDWVYTSNLHWRKRAKATPAMINQAEAEMNVHRLCIEQLLKSYEISAVRPPVLDVEEYKSPSTAAMMLRQIWNVPKGPIHNLFATIEAHGVIVVRCDFQADIDGRSMFAKDRTPIIFVNRNRPMDRQRFTAAHELAHLVMHTDISVSDSRDVEKEAHLFASEFLMPRTELMAHLGANFSMSRLADLKRYWRVSMAAILYRARTENILTDSGYKYWVVQFGKMGFRQSEPQTLEPPQEVPMTLEGLVKCHTEDFGLSYEELAEQCGLYVEEFKEKCMESMRDKIRLLYRNPAAPKATPSVVYKLKKIVG